ncbi:MAG: hypothetical protein Q9219_002233 [cf. Caloplaca sp. 3 TL-2023]
MAVSTVAVILRLIARKISAAPYGADDFLILVALVLTYGLNINEFIAVHYGFGRHQLLLSLEQIEKFLLNDWTIQIIFASAISVTRLSLLVFYHRIFPVKRFTIVAAITGCIMIAWWISFIFAIIFSCYPVASYWDKSIVGHCLNEHTLSWGVTGTELATNIIMLVLPIPWLWNLRLAWTKKLALIGIFTLGCLWALDFILPEISKIANVRQSSVCLPLMRPLVSFQFSTLSTYFSLPRSRRAGSRFTDEEENSSGLQSIGKLCEKPYDGSCTENRPTCDSQLAVHYNIHHPSKTFSGDRSHRDVRTYRSRIESYSPDKYDPLRAHPPSKIRPARKSAPPILDSRKARRNTFRLSKDEMGERYRKWYQGRGSEIGRGYWSLQITAPDGRKGVRGSDLPWEVGDIHRAPPRTKS